MLWNYDFTKREIVYVYVGRVGQDPAEVNRGEAHQHRQFYLVLARQNERPRQGK